jgi:hypothetical protein
MSNIHSYKSQRTGAQAILIREAGETDDDALRMLSQRDSARPPAQPLLVAERGGELRAAISLADGAVVADPFERTANLVELLEARAAHLLQARGRPLRLGARRPSATPRALRHTAS